MNLSTNIMLFQPTFGLKKTLRIFSEAGFSGIDFNTDIKEYHDDTHDKSYYKEIKKLGEDLGLKFSQTHADFRFGNAFADADMAKECFKRVVKGIEHSSYLGSEMIVIHPLTHLNFDIEENKEQMFEYNMKYYKHLIPYAEEYGIKIAIENINSSICQTASGLIELYDELNNPNFVVCFDVGHGNIVGENPPDMIYALGDRIKCTHVHDNNSTSDTHTLPFYGNIEWESVMKAFADINYMGDLNYEASTFVKNLPEELMGKGAGYMAKIGHYLISRFEYYKK